MDSIMANKQYSQYFSEESFWEKIRKYSKSAGITVVYGVLILYYIMQEKGIKIKTKLAIVAALGYFIMPTDALFDLTPLIGYSDDLGVLLFVLTQVSSNITPEIKEKARRKLQDWFGEIEEEKLKELENKII
ncbi:MAG: DUF1232 domain-containing protein [Mariniphaga sp.]|nr:DUF1232 domain-containing protein [Mariniphaga sp.]MDD4424457.1 DUF1232 domain-containing protein [Mariniphaga sp.]